MSKNYTFNLLVIGGIHTGGYQETPEFAHDSDHKYVGCNASYVEGYGIQNYATQYCTTVFKYNDIISVEGTPTSIVLTVNIGGAGNSYRKLIQIAKNLSAWGSSYYYQYEDIATFEVQQGATSFSLDLTSYGLCEYGYLLYQKDKNSQMQPFTVDSAVLNIVTNVTDYSYTLRYDVNGGVGTIPDQTGSNTQVDPLYVFVISNTTPAKDGYDFLGWSLSNSAVSASYSPGDNIEVNNSGITIIYAVWKLKEYPIYYNKGVYGDGINQTAIKYHGIALTLIGETFTRTDYIQDGWSTLDGGQKDYDFGDQYINNVSVTLYPHWKQMLIIHSIDNGSAIACSLYVKTNSMMRVCELYVKQNGQMIKSI